MHIQLNLYLITVAALVGAAAKFIGLLFGSIDAEALGSIVNSLSLMAIAVLATRSSVHLSRG